MQTQVAVKMEPGKQIVQSPWLQENRESAVQAGIATQPYSWSRDWGRDRRDLRARDLRARGLQKLTAAPAKAKEPSIVLLYGSGLHTHTHTHQWEAIYKLQNKD